MLKKLILKNTGSKKAPKVGYVNRVNEDFFSFQKGPEKSSHLEKYQFKKKNSVVAHVNCSYGYLLGLDKALNGARYSWVSMHCFSLI